MRKLMALSVFAFLPLAGCVTHWGVETTKNSVPHGIANFTTGDGTYENYTAQGRFNRTELGIGLGIFTWMLVDLYPKVTAEELVSEVSADAKAAGSNAVINAEIMPRRFYGMIFGFYTAGVEGTGIATKAAP